MKYLPALVLTVLIQLTLITGSAAGTDSLYRAMETAASDSQKLSLMIRISWDLQFSHPDSALGIAHRALALAKESGNKAKEAKAYHLIGSIYDEKGDYTRSLEHYDKAVKLLETVESAEKDMARACSNKGMVYETTGQFPEALEMFHKALAIYEKLNDNEGIASVYSKMTVIFRNLSKFKEALTYSEKALKIYEELENHRSIATTHISFGLIFTEMELYDSAAAHYHLALPVMKSLNDKKGIAILYNNLANVQFYQEDFHGALKNYLASYELAKELQNVFGMLLLQQNIGSVYLKLKEYNRSLEYLLASTEQAKQMGVKDMVKDGYKNIGTAYYELGDYKKAYDYQVLYETIKDSIFTETGLQQVAEMQTKYETEKKELELLKREAEIKEKDAEVKRQNLQKFAFAGGFGFALLLTLIVFRNFRQKQKLNVALEEKNMIIEDKNKSITDSITYAKRIQDALLRPAKQKGDMLPEHFVLLKPKDIVSGDFYWGLEKQGYWYLTVADCTGHGVPGGFMSMLGVAYLNEITSANRLLTPSEILDTLRDKIVNELSQASAEEESNSYGINASFVKDGMDMSLIRLNLQAREMQWAGAHNPLWVGRAAGGRPINAAGSELQALNSAQGALYEIKADHQPIGFHTAHRPFTNHSFQLEEGDSIYLFSDGFADQFGGPKGKKFKSANMKKLLLSIQNETMEKQRQLIDEAFEEWKGELEQIDDVCVIGLRL